MLSREYFRRMIKHMLAILGVCAYAHGARAIVHDQGNAQHLIGFSLRTTSTGMQRAMATSAEAQYTTIQSNPAPRQILLLFLLIRCVCVVSLLLRWFFDRVRCFCLRTRQGSTTRAAGSPGKRPSSPFRVRPHDCTGTASVH